MRNAKQRKDLKAAKRLIAIRKAPHTFPGWLVDIFLVVEIVVRQ